MIRLKAKRLVHGGVLGAIVDFVTPNHIVSSATIDAAATDNWAGRVLVIIGRNNASTPFASFNITGFIPTTGDFTVSQDPVNIVQGGDVFVVATLGYDNSSDFYHLTDSGWVNADNNHAGMTPGAEIGNLVRIIAGKGRGTPPIKIVDNTTDTLTLDFPLVIDSTSVYIVEAPTWDYQSNSAEVTNAIYTTVTQLTMPADNFKDTPLLVSGFNVDDNGVEVAEGDNLVRMLWVYGSAAEGAPTFGMAWMPDLTAPNTGDPMYPDPVERTFDLWQDYFIARDGSWSPAIYVSGYLTINQFVSTSAPVITDLTLASGGSIDGHAGFTLYMAVTQRDSNGSPSTPSNIDAIDIPPGSTGQQVNMTLAPASGTWASWDVWAGIDRRSMALQSSGTGSLPSTYAYPGPLHYNTEALPDLSAKWVDINVKHVIHSGIAGLLVTSVFAPNQIQSNEFIASTDPWVGRVVSAIADADTGHAPLWDFTVTAFNSVTGTLTVSPDCVVPGDSTKSVEGGDVLIVRSIAESVSNDNLTITDSMWNNSVGRSQFGSSDPTWAGLAPNAEVGNIARIIRGSGRGQHATIASNDHLSITLTSPFLGLDSTSILIVEEPSWADTASTSPVAVPASNQFMQARIPVDNLANVVGLVGGFSDDGNGHITDEHFAVFREIFIFGQPPSVRTVGPGAGPWQLDQTDQTVNVDTSVNDVTLQLPPLADYEGRTLLIYSLGTFTVIINTYTDPVSKAQETFYDGSTQVMITHQGGSLRITSGATYA